MPSAARASGFDPRFELEVGASVDDSGRLYHTGTRLPGAVANCYEGDRLCVLPVSALWNAPARSANTLRLRRPREIQTPKASETPSIYAHVSRAA